MDFTQAPLPLILRRLLDARRDRPHVPRRIHDPRGAVAPELIRQRHESPGACRYGALHGFVDVLDIDIEHHRRTAVRQWCAVVLYVYVENVDETVERADV